MAWYFSGILASTIKKNCYSNYTLIARSHHNMQHTMLRYLKPKMRFFLTLGLVLFLLWLFFYPNKGEFCFKRELYDCHELYFLLILFLFLFLQQLFGRTKAGAVKNIMKGFYMYGSVGKCLCYGVHLM